MTQSYNIKTLTKQEYCALLFVEFYISFRQLQTLTFALNLTKHYLLIETLFILLQTMAETSMLDTMIKTLLMQLHYFCFFFAATGTYTIIIKAAQGF